MDSTSANNRAEDPVPTRQRVDLLGSPVTADTFLGAQEFIGGMVERQRGGYVSCSNVFGVMLARDEPSYRALLNAADYVTADGAPIVWALRARGIAAERVHNDDLFLACCTWFPEWRHFLVGGRDGQPDEVAGALRALYPGIRIAGACATPVRPVPEADTQRIVDQIRETRPSIVWVGMGTPAQDVWMASVAGKVDVPMVACGSVFDLLSGRTKAAPNWMKRSGLQWLFRLAQEPRRLTFRYLYYNPRFVAALAADTWRRRSHREPSPR